VNKISFISKDATDNRAFGYTVSESNGKHMFFGIKTEKAVSIHVMTPQFKGNLEPQHL